MPVRRARRVRTTGSAGLSVPWFYGGAPSLLVPDNPRALNVQPDRYEPGLGRTTQEFVNHYATVLLPARPRKPRDKAYVSYCTLCGWWNRDKRRLCRVVAAALPFDQDDVAEGGS